MAQNSHRTSTVWFWLAIERVSSRPNSDTARRIFSALHPQWKLGIERSRAMLDGKHLDHRTVGSNTNVFRNYGHHFFVLVGKYLAKPADAACKRKDGAKEADRQACDQPRKQ